MAGIKGKNTRPELALRKELHRLGFRYRLHSRNVPGKPDMVFSASKAAIFVHGCFWHGHDCKYFRLPGTRTEFWQAKITGNRARDERVRSLLKEGGWRYIVVWECAIRGQGRNAAQTIAGKVATWLKSQKATAEIRGN